MLRRKSFLVLVVLMAVTLTTLSSFSLATAQGPRPPAASSGVPNTFTVQGQLKKLGNPVNDTCDLAFSLWDSEFNPSVQIGNNDLILAVNVSNGLFTQTLNRTGQFGPNPFDGHARWLQTAAKCLTDAGVTTILPRQALTAAPYALALKLPVTESISDTNFLLTLSNAGLNENGGGSGAISGNSQHGFGVYATSNNGTGLYALSNNGNGIYGGSQSAVGVLGYSAANSAIVGGNSNVYPAIYGQNTASGTGIYGTAPISAVMGVATSVSGIGVYGTNSSGIGTGVMGSDTSGYGVAGYTTDGTGVYGIATSAAGIGVYGYNSGGSGGTGVMGSNPSGFGVAGYTTNGTGMYGSNGNSNTTGHAGYFDGRVHVTKGLIVEGNISALNVPGLEFSQNTAGGGLQNTIKDVDPNMVISVPSSGYVMVTAYVKVIGTSHELALIYHLMDMTAGGAGVELTQASAEDHSTGNVVQTMHISWVIGPVNAGNIVLKTTLEEYGNQPGQTWTNHNLTAVYVPVHY